MLYDLMFWGLAHLGVWRGSTDLGPSSVSGLGFGLLDLGPSLVASRILLFSESEDGW